jgi:Peptidase family S41/N-terminal domain of Peptidase_S41 in eukaryotic IRBP
MSEKLYAWLWRLFPRQFRDVYGEDALQLFRDRARDEATVFARLRLWLDLLSDLAVSVPRQYRYTERDLFLAASTNRSSGAPTFYVLNDRKPSAGATISGCLLAMATLCVFSASIKYFGSYAVVGTISAERNRSQSPLSQPQLAPAGDTGSPGSAENSRNTFDAAERSRVLEALASSLRAHYPDRAMAERVASMLLDRESDGAYDAVTGPEILAELVTKEMNQLAGDPDLVLVYSEEPLPEKPGAANPQALAAYRAAMQRGNCTFEKIELLPGNIGYFKLNSFPDASVCGRQAKAAMASLNHADALILDLRDNRGGFPDMTALIGSYLFDHPEYWYNPRETTSAQSWTHSPVSGNLLAHKPVYVLTSSQTISGAEQFAYNLKMLKRATLIGERTAGQAHAGVFIRIDAHFGAGIPEARAINPFSARDWSGRGIEPDVKTDAGNALETAEKLAQSSLIRK